MSDESKWNDDKSLYDKGVELKDAFVRLLKDEDSSILKVFDLNYFPPRMSRSSDLLWDHKNFCQFDEQQLHDVIDTVDQLARSMFGSNGDVGNLAALEAKLSQWKGASAEGFTTQVDRMKEFFPTQANDIAYAAQVVNALLSAAAAARNNFVQLVDTTVAAIKKAMDEATERETEFAIAVVANFATAALEADRAIGRELAKVTASTAIDMAKDGGPVIISGDEFDELMSNYEAGIRRIATQYREDLKTIATKLNRRAELVAAQPPALLDPQVPPPIDVRSTGFRYEMFRSDLRNSPSFATSVEKAAAKKYPPTSGGAGYDPDSTISRRLSGEH
jgi:hypothetical protein